MGIVCACPPPQHSASFSEVVEKDGVMQNVEEFASQLLLCLVNRPKICTPH